GRPQNEIKRNGKAMFDELYADPARLEQFMAAMTGVSRGNFEAFADKFDFAPFASHVHIGGAAGQPAPLLQARPPPLPSRTLDLRVVRPIAERHMRAAGLEGRVAAGEIDFFKDEFPSADLITMGMIL